MSGTQDYGKPQPTGRLKTITNSDSLHEEYAKIKSRKNNKWKTRYVTLIKGESKKPCLLLMFKGSDKEKLKTYAEVHSISVKSNADDIRVNDVGNQVYIRTFTAEAHIKWIAALKYALTQRVYFPIKHHGLDDDEYSLLHIKESKYSDHTQHHLIVIHSPYEGTTIRHCWDSLEIKQLRALQEGILLEFCPHCSKSVNFIKLGFTLRLSQKEIKKCLEYICEHTAAKRKRDEQYIYEMISHYNVCAHSPPVRAPPNEPPAPTDMHLTLYNISDVLFKDKKPSLSRASKSLLVQEGAVTSSSAVPQRELHYTNQDSDNGVAMTTHETEYIYQDGEAIAIRETGLSDSVPHKELQALYMNQDSENGASVATNETGSSDETPQRELHYMNQNGEAITTCETGSSDAMPQTELQYMNDLENQVALTSYEKRLSSSVPQRKLQYTNQDYQNETEISTHNTSAMQGQSYPSAKHARIPPPIKPRSRVSSAENHQEHSQLMGHRFSGRYPRKTPIPKPRRGPIAEHIYDDTVSPSKQNSQSHKLYYVQSTITAKATVDGDEASSGYHNYKDKPAVKRRSSLSKKAHNKPPIPRAASYVDERRAKLTSSPDVVSIPLTKTKMPAMSISAYRKQVMDKKPSYSETGSSGTTFPQQKTPSAPNEKFKEMHSELQHTIFYQHT